jgi:hypothetical protein
MLRVEEHPPVGGDMAWVFQYRTNDTLSSAYKKLFDKLQVLYTSRLQYDMILDL